MSNIPENFPDSQLSLFPKLPPAGHISPLQGIDIEYRAATSDDINFILNSWMVSYRRTARLPDDIYFVKQQRLIAQLATHAQLIIACDQSTPDYILGYICGESVDKEFRVHYVYVKHSYRRLGLGRELLKALGWVRDTVIVASHHTPAACALQERFNIIFDDYIIKEGNHL